MRKVAVAVSLLIFATNAMLLVRLLWGGVRPADMQPKVEYFVTLQMSADLHGEAAKIRVLLPRNSEYQSVQSERVESHLLSYSLDSDSLNRFAIWSGERVSGHESALYDAVVYIRPRRFELPASTPFPPAYPDDVVRYLEPSDTIQSDAPEIQEAARRLLGGTTPQDVTATVEAIYRFVHESIESSDYENTLDAVTTLKWEEAFCGGKSRLLAALLRASDIPARIVGGLILRPGSKRTTHVWVEAWINGVWVPFDALNGHYAEHPGNYLVLYRGDEALTSHSRNINFQYIFNIKKWRTPPDVRPALGKIASLNAYVFWEPFRSAHISLNLLRIILLLPVGVLIVIFFRNVVGITTFGTFHPALIAVAFRGSGLAWGLGLYLSVLVFGMGVRLALNRVELLHTPRLSIMLIFVVIFMVVVTYVSVQSGVLEPAHVSMFPIAILAITIESFFTKSVELGLRQALSVMLQTLVVIAAVYATLDSHFLQTLVFGFPELLLSVTAGYLVLGRFVGMRLSEYRRFRWLLVA